MELPKGKLQIYVSVLVLIFIGYAECVQYYEGDSCDSNGISGKCSLVSKCHTHAVFIQQNLLTSKDIKSCGLAVYEEIICCPLDNESNRNQLTANRPRFQSPPPSGTPIGGQFGDFTGDSFKSIQDEKLPSRENPNMRKLCNPYDKDCIVFRDDEKFQFKAGDLCSFKSYVGTCQERSRCTGLKELFDLNLVVNDDVLSCGLTVYEELVCCPDY